MRKRLRGTETLQQVDYSAHQKVPSRHPSFINFVSNILLLSPDEIARDGERSDSGRKPKVRLEQKSIALMKDLAQNFCNPGQLVLDPFAGTLPTSKAFLLVDKYRRFVGCDKDV